MATIFDYWRLPKYRDRITESYCKDVEHIRKYHPEYTDSKVRRVAIDHMTDDLLTAFNDFARAFESLRG